MTYSETRFRRYLKKLFNHPSTYVKKVADKKQGVGSANTGMPDYLVISEGRTLWFEVKLSRTKTTFNLNLISAVQYSEFTKMINAGAKVLIAVYINGELYIVDFKELQLAKFAGEKVSVTINELEKWRVIW